MIDIKDRICDVVADKVMSAEAAEIGRAHV